MNLKERDRGKQYAQRMMGGEDAYMDAIVIFPFGSRIKNACLNGTGKG